MPGLGLTFAAGLFGRINILFQKQNLSVSQNSSPIWKKKPFTDALSEKETLNIQTPGYPSNQILIRPTRSKAKAKTQIR